MRAVGFILFFLSLLAAINVIAPTTQGENIPMGTLIASFWLLLGGIFFGIQGPERDQNSSQVVRVEPEKPEKKECHYCGFVDESGAQFCPGCEKDAKGNTKEHYKRMAEDAEYKRKVQEDIERKKAQEEEKRENEEERKEQERLKDKKEKELRREREKQIRKRRIKTFMPVIILVVVIILSAIAIIFYG